MSAPHVLVDRDGPVVTVTMNRPEAKNALGLEMIARLADAWKEIDEDPSVRVAILTGAAGTFSAGADLKGMNKGHADDPWQPRFAEDPELAWKGFMRGHRLRKPLVAAVEGIAFGGGTEILLATDIRVAAETAQFGVTEAKWGLFPLGGSTVRLGRQIPYAKAMEMLLLARPISAREALEFGLVSRVVPEGEALAEARRIAETIATNGPLAVQAIKQSALEAVGKTEPEALARELELGWPIVFDTEDAKEGQRAFADKRRPEFRGR